MVQQSGVEVKALGCYQTQDTPGRPERPPKQPGGKTSTSYLDPKEPNIGALIFRIGAPLKGSLKGSIRDLE